MFMSGVNSMSIFENIGKKITSVSQDAVRKTKDFADTAKLNSMISDEDKYINNCYTQLGKMYFEKYSDSPEEDFIGIIDSIKAAEVRKAEHRKKIETMKVNEYDSYGNKICRVCGAVLPPDSMFCVSCGSKVEEQKPSESNMKKCISCGREIGSDMKFCSYCGALQENKQNDDQNESIQNAGNADVDIDFNDGDIQNSEPEKKSELNVETDKNLSESDNEYSSSDGFNGNEEREQDIQEKQPSVTEPVKNTDKDNGVRFCKVCGAKVDKDSVFCMECGARI